MTNPLTLSPSVVIIAYMATLMRDRYLGALALLNVSEVARDTGRARQTLTAYRMGTRTVTSDAVRELARYLRYRAEVFTAAAKNLEAALKKGDS